MFSQLVSSWAPASPLFSGWNCVADSAVFSTPATKRSPCSAQVTFGFGSGDGAVVLAEGEVADAVGVHEVEALVLDAVEEHAARRDVDLVPAHVRQDGGLQLLDHAGPLAAALGVVAVLDAAVEEDLHPDADAEHRTATGEAAADDPGAVDGLEALHARGEGADAGDDEAVGVQGGLRVGGHRDVGTHAGQRALGRAQIARPVVEDRHLLHACHATDQRSGPSP